MPSPSRCLQLRGQRQHLSAFRQRQELYSCSCYLAFKQATLLFLLNFCNTEVSSSIFDCVLSECTCFVLIRECDRLYTFFCIFINVLCDNEQWYKNQRLLNFCKNSFEFKVYLHVPNVKRWKVMFAHMFFYNRECH